MPTSTGKPSTYQLRTRRLVILLSLVAAAVLLMIAGYSLYMYYIMHRPRPAGPVVLVEARYADASAETMDRMVIDPLCVSLYGTQDINEMLGVSTSDGKGQVYLHLRPKAQVGIVFSLIQNRIAQTVPTLPAGVVPTVRILEDEAPPLWLVLGGSVHADQLAGIAEKEILPAAAKLEGVAEAHFAGLAPGEPLRGPGLDIVIDAEKVRKEGISLADANQMVREELARKPEPTIEQFQKHVVKGTGGHMVPLGEIASIKEVMAFRSVARWGGKKVIAIALHPVEGESNARLYQRLVPHIPALQEKLPRGAEIVLLAP